LIDSLAGARKVSLTDTALTAGSFAQLGALPGSILFVTIAEFIFYAGFVGFDEDHGRFVFRGRPLGQERGHANPRLCCLQS
jgi:hypothetical protein